MALAQLYFQKGEHAKTVQAADAILARCAGASARHAGAPRRSPACAISPRARGDFGNHQASSQRPGGATPTGGRQHGRKEVKEAEDGFRKLYESNPKESRSLFGLVECYLAQQTPQKQAQALELIQKGRPATRERMISPWRWPMWPLARVGPTCPFSNSRRWWPSGPTTRCCTCGWGRFIAAPASWTVPRPLPHRYSACAGSAVAEASTCHATRRAGAAWRGSSTL